MYIGWKSKKYSWGDYSFSFGNTKKTIYYMLNLDVKKGKEYEALKRIQEFEKKNKFYGIPRIIACYGMKGEYHPNDLEFFCFPENKKIATWVDSIVYLDDNIKNYLDPQDVVWKYPEKSIKDKIEVIDSQIETLQQEKKELMK